MLFLFLTKKSATDPPKKSTYNRLTIYTNQPSHLRFWLEINNKIIFRLENWFCSVVGTNQACLDTSLVKAPFPPPHNLSPLHDYWRIYWGGEEREGQRLWYDRRKEEGGERRIINYKNYLWEWFYWRYEIEGTHLLRVINMHACLFLTNNRIKIYCIIKKVAKLHPVFRSESPT